MILGVILDEYFFRVIMWIGAIGSFFGMLIYLGSKYPGKSEIAGKIFLVIALIGCLIGLANSIAVAERREAARENHSAR